jgi:hypothetical protein
MALLILIYVYIYHRLFRRVISLRLITRKTRVNPDGRAAAGVRPFFAVNNLTHVTG